MIQADHLQVWELRLKVRTPLFIGSGKELSKSDYCFDPRSGMISVIDFNALTEKLVSRRLTDNYTHFVLGSRYQDLGNFLRYDCRFTPVEIAELTLYTADASDALDQNHSLMTIRAFARDSQNRVYVPGSSVKGALRTALLYDKIQAELSKSRMLPPIDNRGNVPEDVFFNTLRFAGRSGSNAVNSILQGLRISDSQPIGNENIIITRKRDVSVRGYENKLNLCRESIKPGTEISFSVTLDCSVLKDNLTVEGIQDAVDRFAEYYSNRFLPCFDLPRDVADINMKNALILGGGSGYFSKTVTYPYFGDEALEIVSNMMERSFRRHGHQKDHEDGISPHMLKYTRYNGMHVPYGVCEVSFR